MGATGMIAGELWRNTKFWRAFVLLLLALTNLPLALPALAQDKKAPIFPDPMRVVLVRAATPVCAPNCDEWISAEGDITKETPALFRSVLKKIGNKRIPVLIRSRGGHVDAALQIGHMLRQKKLDVAVLSTSFSNCKPNESACIKASEFKGFIGYPGGYRSGFCTSACVFVLAGGVNRFVLHPGLVGVHQVSQQQTRVLRRYRISYRIINGKRVETRRVLLSEQRGQKEKVELGSENPVYSRLARYFDSMGINTELVDLSHRAGAENIYWLSLSEQIATRIVRTINGYDKIFGNNLESLDQLETAVSTFQKSNVIANIAHSKLEMGKSHRKAIQLKMEFFLDSATQLVDVEITPIAAEQKLQMAGLTMLIEMSSASPILAMRATNTVAVTPLRASMTKAVFCSLVKEGAVSLTLQSLKKIDTLPLRLTRTLPRLPIEMKVAGETLCGGQQTQ